MCTMINKSNFVLSWCLFLGAMTTFFSCNKDRKEFTGFKAPSHFPQPVYPLDVNPVTYDGFLLGKKLFYDGRLSRDGSISCGSCHIQYSAFSHHGHDVSHGIDDRLGRRNAPGLQNLAWGKSFFWDGGVHNLDMVPFLPITHPDEMDDNVPHVLSKLQQDGDYVRMFKKAFGSEEINSMRMMQALSQFMVMLVTAQSPYDRYIRGDKKALSSEEKEGLNIFRAKCASCHAEPLFTDESYRNNGLDTSDTDLGRYEVSLISSDRFKFKVPTLRNLKYTAPYMHTGKMNSLNQVLEHYRSGVVHSSTLDPTLNGGIPISEQEKSKIILFLNTLNDEGFVRNPLFSEN